MIKTVILDGAEMRVTGLGGQNTMIVNFGGAMLYASVRPDIVPDGKGAAAISAGGAMNLRDTNGTVYLLGTGKVQIEGTDYGTVDIGMPSASGGYTPAPAVETMPVMDGITAWFDGNSRLSSFSEVAIGFNSEEGGALLMRSRDGFGRIYSEDMPVIVYMVFKTPNNGTIIDRSISPGYDYGLGIYITDGKITVHSCNADGIISDVSASEYHVIAAVGYDDREDGKTTQKLYIDGKHIGTNSNNYSASAHAREIYGGYMAINGIARPGFKFDSDLNLYLKYFGMGSVAHTDEQIKANCEWLMKKYLGGE